jgi:hypothetical protein
VNKLLKKLKNKKLGMINKKLIIAKPKETT